MFTEGWKKLFAYHPDSYDYDKIAYDNKSDKQELYIAIPKGKKNFTTIIYFHGGGLFADGIEMPARLIDGETALITVRYRVSDGISGDNALDALDDAVLASAKSLDLIKELGGNMEQIFIGGTSAGAWQAAMVVMAPQLLAKYNHNGNEFAGLICVSGQLGTHFTLKRDLKYKEEPWAPVIDEYAPLKYVRADLPPILLITGDPQLEMPTRVEENRYMAAALRAVGHKDVSHYVFEGHKHGDIHLSCDRMIHCFVCRLTGKEPQAVGWGH